MRRARDEVELTLPLVDYGAMDNPERGLIPHTGFVLPKFYGRAQPSPAKYKGRPENYTDWQNKWRRRMRAATVLGTYGPNWKEGYLGGKSGKTYRTPTSRALLESAFDYLDRRSGRPGYKYVTITRGKKNPKTSKYWQTERFLDNGLTYLKRARNPFVKPTLFLPNYGPLKRATMDSLRELKGDELDAELRRIRGARIMARQAARQKFRAALEEAHPHEHQWERKLKKGLYKAFINNRRAERQAGIIKRQKDRQMAAQLRKTNRAAYRARIAIRKAELPSTFIKMRKGQDMF